MITRILRAVAESLDSLADGLDRPHRLERDMQALEGRVRSVDEGIRRRQDAIEDGFSVRLAAIEDALQLEQEARQNTVSPLTGRIEALAVRLGGIEDRVETLWEEGKPK